MIGAGKNIFIVGGDELNRKISKLYSLGSRTTQIRSAFNRASKPLRMKARSNAKQLNSGGAKNTGTLWKSIKLVQSKKYKTLFYVGPTRGRKRRFDAWYAVFLELGTKSRETIGSQRMSRLGNIKGKSGGAGRGRIRARKFMMKAYLSTRNKVQRNIRKELDTMIKKLVA